MPGTATGWHRRALTCAGIPGLVLGIVLPAAAQDIGYTGSLFVSRGSYPALDEVTSVYVFNTVDVGTGPFRLSVSVPFLRRRTTFTDVAADPLTGTTLPATETSTGLGDPLVRADVRVVDEPARSLQVSLAGSVKPALLSADSGRGTGETDVGVGGSVFKGFGRTSAFADVLFWKYGDPEGVDFEDSVAYSVGVGRILGNGRWSAMLSLAGFTGALEGEDPPLQLNASLLALASQRQSVAFNAGFGLTDSAGGFSIGTSWRIQR